MFPWTGKLTAWTNRGVVLLLQRLNPNVTIKVLDKESLDGAAQLVAQMFARHEPLCKHLQLTYDQVLPFFHQLLTFNLSQQVSLVAVDQDQRVLAVTVVEDHARQYDPSDFAVNPKLELIGRLLQRAKLPPELDVQRTGQVYCNSIVATRSGYGRRGLMLWLMLAMHNHLQQKGYLTGYGKVSNPHVQDNFNTMESLFRLKIFTTHTQVEPRNQRFDSVDLGSVRHGGYPFQGFEGVIRLVSWKSYPV